MTGIELAKAFSDLIRAKVAPAELNTVCTLTIADARANGSQMRPHALNAYLDAGESVSDLLASAYVATFGQAPDAATSPILTDAWHIASASLFFRES